MTEYGRLLALFQRTGAHHFATLREWALSKPEGVPARLAAYYADRPADSWWAVAFNRYRKEARRHVER